MQQSSLAGRRPMGITILAIVALLGGVLNLLVGSDLLGIGGATAASSLGTIAGIVLVLTGIVNFAVAYGYWRLEPWAWLLGVVTWVAAIVSSVLQYMNDNTILVSMAISVIIAVLVLVYLFRPQVRAAFGRA